MNNFLKSRMIQGMVPYFVLAIAVIVSWQIIAHFSFFTDTVGRFLGYLAPFATGAIIAYILNLPCTGIQRLLECVNVRFIVKRSRSFSVILLLIMVIVLIILILNLVLPALYRNILFFINELPNYATQFTGFIDYINSWDLPDFVPEIRAADILNWVQETVLNIEFGNIGQQLFAGLGGGFSAVLRLFLAIVSSIYYLIEKDKIKAFVKKFVSAVTKPVTSSIILKYSRKLNHNFTQYIVTQTIDGFILGTLMFITLRLFGSPFALILAVMLGIINYIPYFGSIIGTTIAVLVVAFTQGIPTAGIAAVVMFIIQQTDGNFIQPKLMGETFRMSPLIIIISVTIGNAYAGVLGMLVAIPIVAILKDLYDSYIDYKLTKKQQPKTERFYEKYAPPEL